MIQIELFILLFLQRKIYGVAVFSFTKILSFDFLNSHFFQAFEQMKKTSAK